MVLNVMEIIQQRKKISWYWEERLLRGGPCIGEWNGTKAC